MSVMNSEEIEQLLTTEVANILCIDEDDVAVEAPLHALGMTSMSFVELLVVIERVFELRLIETDLSRDDFRTIRSLALRISRLKQPAAW